MHRSRTRQRDSRAQAASSHLPVLGPARCLHVKAWFVNADGLRPFEGGQFYRVHKFF
jgi:hypothetical protein